VDGPRHVLDRVVRIVFYLLAIHNGSGTSCDGGKHALPHMNAKPLELIAPPPRRPVKLGQVSPRISALARSASMMVGALVLPVGRLGITEASTTRRPSTPRTRSCGSTTAIGP